MRLWSAISRLQADGHPVVIPTAIARDGDVVLAHGSTGSRWMRALARGAPTALGGHLARRHRGGRSAFESSMHYRSAVLFGSCEPVEDPAGKRAALDLITDALLPGRVAEVREPTPEGARSHSRASAADRPVVAQDLRRLARGSRSRCRGPGLGRRRADDGCGTGQPRPAPDLRAGIDVPDSSVRRLDRQVAVPESTRAGRPGRSRRCRVSARRPPIRLRSAVHMLASLVAAAHPRLRTSEPLTVTRPVLPSAAAT